MKENFEQFMDSYIASSLTKCTKNIIYKEKKRRKIIYL